MAARLDNSLDIKILFTMSVARCLFRHLCQSQLLHVLNQICLHGRFLVSPEWQLLLNDHPTCIRHGQVVAVLLQFCRVLGGLS